MKPIRAFKLTKDNWHPSYQLKGWHKGVEQPLLVEVSLLTLSDGQFRVCVWGGDDCGMEKDHKEYREALDLFDQLLQEEFVSMKGLKELGFVTA